MEFAEKLRVVADLLERHADLPQPVVFAYSSGSVNVAWQLMNDDSTKENQRDAAVRIRRAIGGEWSKCAWGDRFDLARDYEGLRLQILTHREQVCERVVTGTETVTIPAVAAQPERTEEREVVEWRCDPVLSGDAEEDAA